MATPATSAPVTSPQLTPVPAPAPVSAPKSTESPSKPYWQHFGVPAAVILLAVAVAVTVLGNWNSWEGGRALQVTDDASVRGDVTPLSTKVAGIVRDVRISDFQSVSKGDLLVQLDDDDYQAQVAQA